jgi:predicted HAD superfamily hydrolase
MLKTFDIFDTLLCRSYVHPEELFEHIGLLIGINNYKELRVEAELNARRKQDFNKEVTIRDIYEELSYLIELKENFYAELMQREIDMELMCLNKISKGISLLEKAYNEGSEVLLISDMYLPEEVIYKALKLAGINVAKEKLFVSSVHGKMKSNGTLFQHVSELLDIRLHEISHTGDNEHSDYNVPESLGISATHFKDYVSNRYEQHNQESNFLIKLAHGVSRQLRLSKPPIYNSCHCCIYDTSVNIAGPLVFAYAYWCLREAVKKGIKNLYFLSRDGQIVHKVAQKIADRYFKNQINLRYLYVSRQALLLPSLTEIGDQELEWILARTHYLSIRIVFQRVDLNPDLYNDDLRLCGLTKRFDEQLDDLDVDNFRKFLSLISQDIKQKASDKRQILLAYLAQEGFFGIHTCGIVDAGWSGTLQRSLSKVLAMQGKLNPMYGFYFGVARTKTSKKDPMIGWFFDINKPRHLIQTHYVIPIIEMILAADHGGVQDYKLGQNGILPNLKYELNNRAIIWGLQYQHMAILNFADRYLELSSGIPIDDIPEILIDDIEKNLEQFFVNPIALEAKSYGAYMDAEDQSESYYLRLAQGYDFKEICEYFKTGKKHHHNEWIQGAMVLSGGDFVQFVRRYLSGFKKLII